MVLIAGTPVLMSAQSADADSPRQQAVSQYIDGATKELTVYRDEISADARPEDQQLLADAKAKLAQCDSLVRDLKAADEAHFDVVKADYERTRGQLAKAIQAAQQK
jgi:hypothetical protein